MKAPCTQGVTVVKSRKQSPVPCTPALSRTRCSLTRQQTANTTFRFLVNLPDLRLAPLSFSAPTTSPSTTSPTLPSSPCLPLPHPLQTPSSNSTNPYHVTNHPPPPPPPPLPPPRTPTYLPPYPPYPTPHLHIVSSCREHYCTSTEEWTTAVQ